MPINQSNSEPVASDFQESMMDRSRLRVLLALSPAVIYTCRPDGDYAATFISENIRNQLGYEPSDFTEDPNFWARRIHPDDRDRVFHDLYQLFQSGSHVHEYRFLHRDGNYRWMRDELRLLKDQAGMPVEIVGSWLDISERRAMEDDLRNSWKRFEEAQSVGHLGSWNWMIAKDACQCSVEFYRIFQLDPDTFDGTYDSFLRCVHPEDRDMVNQAIQKSLNEGTPFVKDYRIVCPDKSLHYINSHGKVEYDEADEPVCMVVTVQDITDRKSAEIQLKQTQKINRVLVDVIPDALLLLDHQGTVIDANPVAAQRLGLSSGQLIGSHIFAELPAEIVPQRKKCLAEVIETGGSLRFVDQRDGSWVEHYMAPIKNEQGVVDYVAVIGRDMTETWRSEQQLLDYQKRLRTLAAELSLLKEKKHRDVARALHDNLGSILALAKLQLGQLRNQTLDLSQSAQIDEIRALLTNCIDFTRSLTYELSPPVLEGLSFGTSLRWLGEHFLEKNNIKVRFSERGEQGVLADNDRITLYSIIRELLINIIKHAEASRVVILLTWSPAEMRMTLEDNGVGFDVRQQQKEAFEKRSYGLFSIRERLTYLNGDIVIQSKPQQGTRVIIRVPVGQQENGDDQDSDCR